MPLLKNRSKAKTVTHTHLNADGYYYDPSELTSYFIRKPTIWETMLELMHEHKIVVEEYGSFTKETNKVLK